MDKKRVDLRKGYMEVYNFGEIKLHAYQTNDLMNDECYILENKDNLLLIEFPAFRENLEEFQEYVKKIGKNIVGKVFSDHPNGGTYFENIPAYASEGTIKSMKEGTINGLVSGFIKSFGEDFIADYHKITNILNDDSINIGGFELNITYHDEDIEIEFPQINSIYTHMLGHDCHSIVAGEKHADVIIDRLEFYKQKGYNLILSSHYVPENLNDVDTKISYLKDLKIISKNSSGRENFINNVKSKYPNYSGLNYLDMTAGYFFKE